MIILRGVKKVSDKIQQLLMILKSSQHTETRKECS